MILLVVILAIVFFCMLDVALPAVAFFTTGTGWASIKAAFTADGWNRAISYITSSPEWDRWLVIIAVGLGALLWLVTFIMLLTKEHPLRAIGSIFAFAINVLVAYIYIAWPNPEVFALWQKIIIYISLCLYPLSLISTAIKTR